MIGSALTAGRHTCPFHPHFSGVYQIFSPLNIIAAVTLLKGELLNKTLTMPSNY